MTILDKLRTLAAGANIPRPVRAVAAGAAITWGTAVAAQLAEESADQVNEAEVRLGDLGAQIADQEKYLAFIRDGGRDAAVKARAAALGWGPAVDVDQLVEHLIRGVNETVPGDEVMSIANLAASVRRFFTVQVMEGPIIGVAEDEPVEHDAG